ncbi:hypothetical protein Pfo_010152 [Paulownia fortunei]|nr:hypothetical protein Pfo_010152 [Paulownia fortunei]
MGWQISMLTAAMALLAAPRPTSLTYGRSSRIHIHLSWDSFSTCILMRPIRFGEQYNCEICLNLGVYCPEILVILHSSIEEADEEEVETSGVKSEVESEDVELIKNLLNTAAACAPTLKGHCIVDGSYSFFVVIPSTHPHVIMDEDHFKSKVKLLEALQDIEITFRLVSFDAAVTFLTSTRSYVPYFSSFS